MPENTEPKNIILTQRDHNRLSWWVRGTTSKRSDPISEFMGEELERASIVPSMAVPANIVTMNSHVAVRDHETGEVRSLILVYPGAEDSSVNNLSILTPVGLAILGLAEGDTASWVTRNGKTRKVKIEKVLYQPEADGRYDI